jgi:hypothetical protein
LKLQRIREPTGDAIRDVIGSQLNTKLSESLNAHRAIQIFYAFVMVRTCAQRYQAMVQIYLFPIRRQLRARNSESIQSSLVFNITNQCKSLPDL